MREQAGLARRLGLGVPREDAPEGAEQEVARAARWVDEAYLAEPELLNRGLQRALVRGAMWQAFYGDADDWRDGVVAQVTDAVRSTLAAA